MTFRRLWAATIWAHGAIPATEYKYRNLKRVVLPLYDLLIILGGVSAYRYGVPAIQALFDERVTTVGAVVFILAGVTCLVGVAFPRLATLEIWSKIAVISLLTSYLVALVLLTTDGDPTRGFVSVIALMALLVPFWRISLLSAERAERRRRGE